jgi:hypothetical protein
VPVGKLALVAAMALLAGGGAAQAANGWYVSGSAGAYLRQDTRGTGQFTKAGAPPAEGENATAYDAGFTLQAAVGRRVTPHLRLEAELGYASYLADHANPVTDDPLYPRLDGRTYARETGARSTRLTGALASFYDFGPVAAGLAPYLGGGLGVADAWTDSGLFQAADGAPLHLRGGDRTGGFGFVETGLSIPLTAKLSFVPSYRYAHAFGGVRDRASVLSGGLRYAF